MCHSGHNVALYWVQLVYIYTQQYSPMQSEMKYNLSRPDNSFFFCGIKPRMNWTLLSIWTFKFEIWPDKVNFTTLSERIQGGRPPSCISTPPQLDQLTNSAETVIHFLRHRQRFPVGLKSKLCLFCASSVFVFVQFWNGSEQRNTVGLWLTK